MIYVRHKFNHTHKKRSVSYDYDLTQFDDLAATFDLCRT